MGVRETAPRVSDAKDFKTIDTESLDSIRFVYFNLRKLYLHLNSVIIFLKLKRVYFVKFIYSSVWFTTKHVRWILFVCLFRHGKAKDAEQYGSKRTTPFTFLYFFYILPNTNKRWQRSNTEKSNSNKTATYNGLLLSL